MKMSALRIAPAALLGLLAFVVAPVVVHAADFIDTFDTTANVGSAFNGLGVSVSDGQLTLTRTASGADMGLDWRPASTGFFSLADTPSFRLEAAAAVNDAYYIVTALFFDDLGDYVGENNIQPDTNALGTFTYDLESVAGIGATQWFARVRVNPFTYAGGNPAFTFNEFAAINPANIPEPSTCATLAGLASLGLVACLRRSHAPRRVASS